MKVSQMGSNVSMVLICLLVFIASEVSQTHPVTQRHPDQASDDFGPTRQHKVNDLKCVFFLCCWFSALGPHRTLPSAPRRDSSNRFLCTHILKMVDGYFVYLYFVGNFRRLHFWMTFFKDDPNDHGVRSCYVLAACFNMVFFHTKNISRLAMFHFSYFPTPPAYKQT